jgi:hypothetical protein
MAEAVDAKANIQSGDRDLEALIAMAAVVHDEFEQLMLDFDQHA